MKSKIKKGVFVTVVLISTLLLAYCALSYLEKIKFDKAIFTSIYVAPIGANYLFLYKNGEIEFGSYIPFQHALRTGTYSKSGDTIFVHSEVFKEQFPLGFFTIKEKRFFTHQGMAYFDVTKNEL